ncbi:MAG: hypothetical protein GKS01_18460 [Alphaproteobacteria bacterium]|nr:hypothetical protein [Alphaproteobacteria bacterium]
MKTTLISSIAVFSVLGLAGCQIVMVEDSPGPRSSYFDGDFEYAGHKGAVYTIVRGNPFGGSQERFAKIVRSKMKNQARAGRPISFVGKQNKTTYKPYKIVVGFNPGNRDGDDLCKSSDYPQSRGSTTKVVMAFCFGDTLKSSSTGWVDGLKSINDANFTKLVKETTNAMIPSYDGHDIGEGGNITN